MCIWFVVCVDEYHCLGICVPAGVRIGSFYMEEEATRASCMLGKCFTTEPHLKPLTCFLSVAGSGHWLSFPLWASAFPPGHGY